MKKITKVSFRKGGDKGVVIHYKTFDENGPSGETTKKNEAPPHADLTAKMAELKKHALFIAEWNGLSAEKYKKFENYQLSQDEEDNIRIVGINISGEGEKEGVIITIYRTLSTGLGYVFNTPLTRLNSDSETAYKFCTELNAAIADVEKEADEYLRGKYGVMQGELFDTEPVENED